MAPCTYRGSLQGIYDIVVVVPYLNILLVLRRPIPEIQENLDEQLEFLIS